ncbi:MAG: hypothetical protein CVU05_02510 [Bacteroidetes bacterium HGW-Bacteroidetes-21]|nr:MAG: hypothetical protein CVU05_02510 [Bacteroidetes bacterium HGW-Bacteroidetes-21]
MYVDIFINFIFVFQGMKVIFFSILFFWLAEFSFAQPYANDWVDYNKTYFKIPLTGEGIYRVSYATLNNSNLQFPINSISPKNIQLYIKGREWPIFISGEEDGIFHNYDYIEFYAPASDGWLDSLMYSPNLSITNPYYSLVNDTLFAYLTWNQSLNNLRAGYETDVNYSAYTAWQSLWCKSNVIWHNPQYFYSGADDPAYQSGEGWFDEYFQLGSQVTRSLSTPGYVAGVYPVTASYSVAGASNATTYIGSNHHLRLSVGSTPYADTLFLGYKAVKGSFDVSGALTAQTQFKAESVNDLNVPADRMTIGYLTLEYPRNYNLLQAEYLKFKLPSMGGAKTLISFAQIPSSGIVLWDISRFKKILCTGSGTNAQALLPDNGSELTCYMSSVAQIKNAVLAGKFEPVNYKNVAGNSTYIIITHKSLWASAQQYKSYRDSKGYPTALIDIDQLYSQFSYGINKHPLAIRNFIEYALDSFNVKPEYVFLIGKSIHSGKWSYNECFRKSNANYDMCLVPSWGSPSSDHMLVAGIDSVDFYMPLSIGRLAAVTNADVTNYLAKVTAFENQPPSLWMKNVLHFGGGQSSYEQQLFAGFLSNYASVISDTLFGAMVHTFLKTSSVPVQITLSDSIRNLINGGCSLMNFFGHGSSSGFDQNIQEPSYYTNTGKYPLLIANSCLTGDIHLPPPLRLGETWVLTPSKGSIAFLASVDIGYAVSLNFFTSEFVRQFSYKHYGYSIGRQVSETINYIVTGTTYDQTYVNSAMDFTLHGDPAIILNSFRKPDLMVNNTSLFYTPTELTTIVDSFDVHVIVYNLGRTVADTFLIELTRTLPSGQSEIFYKSMSGCILKDTVTYRLPVDVVNGPGVNRFCVRVDSENWIDEENETNNSVCVDKVIVSGDLVPVYPYEYAIFPSNTVTLKASSGYPFLSPQQCVFQIDTTDNFYTPLSQGILTYSGGVASWQPPFTLTDSTVYYWRVSLIPSAGQSYNWKESSFIYIPGKTGWSQAHFFQFKKDDFSFINYNRNQRSFDFDTSPTLITCHNIGSPSSSQFVDIKYAIEGLNDYSSCGPGNAILVVVIDPETLIPWESNKSDYGQTNYPLCPSRTRYDRYYQFYVDPGVLSSMNDFLQNEVPDGYYLLIYSFRNGMFSSVWDDVPGLYETFESLGATSVRAIPDNYPYIFFCKKGDISTAVETIGSSSTATIDFEHQINLNVDYGYITSTIVGPSSRWGSLHWRYTHDAGLRDIANLNVTAIAPNGNRMNVFTNLDADSLDIYDLETHVNAQDYPFLELKLYAKDDTLTTPVQLKRWQVTYDGIPETAINPPSGFVFEADTLDEGEDMLFGVATENISEFDMDSLLVKYWLTDNDNNLAHIGVRRLRPHPAGDVLMDTIRLNTTGYQGLNNIWYEVNTENSTTGYFDQLEQYHFNNVVQKSFFVKSDITNPILDVTFDGVHIMNGDIVSAKPQILIALKDENKFLALNDTSIFNVYIKDMQTGLENRVYFSQTGEMQFIPAVLPKNSCKIKYNPVFVTDGIYELRVQARDVSSNESGDFDYLIRFEVINKSTVTHLFNYPNPFSTSTRFVFTLTGWELPDDLRIQIMTVTGKLVREIKLEELGAIHIGTNITEFAWDGTDEYGDKLANGVYFYRVFTKINGSSIEHRETDADNYFKKDFGKLYIMR